MAGAPTRFTQIVAILLMIGWNAAADAFEPVTALDDGFAVPAAQNMAESGAIFPGVESFAKKGYAIVAWKQPFGLDELSVTTVHAGVGLGCVGFSATFTAGGFDLYGDETEKIGVSLAPFPNVSIGARLTRTAMRIKGFGSAEVMSADAGFVYRPVDSVILAAAFEDIANSSLGESKEPLDGVTRFAASWRMADRVTLLAGICDVPRWDPSVSAGFTVQAAGPLTIGVMGGNEPDRIEFLVRVAVSRVRFAWRGGWQPDLGMTHGCSLMWGGEATE